MLGFLPVCTHSGSREKHPPEPGPKLPAAVQPVSRELLGELSGLEAVRSGVLGEGAQHPTVEDMTRNLLEQQPPTRTKHPRDLGDGLLPLRNGICQVK